jgi:hypothetical protein
MREITTVQLPVFPNVQGCEIHKDVSGEAALGLGKPGAKPLDQSGQVLQIPLTKGHVAIIDAEDAPKVNGLSWYALVSASSEQIYAATRDKRVRGKSAILLMHRLITDAPVGMMVDHENRNGLDNRKGNLRVCTQSQNMANQKRRSIGSSAYKGVSWSKWMNRWKACVQFNYRIVHIGYFSDEIDAAKAYDSKARELFGEYARCNFEETSNAA